MKTILTLAALVLLTGFNAMAAGYIQAPSVYSLLVDPVFMASGGGTAPGPSTNMLAADQRYAFVGANGFGISCNMSGTNATTTTNVTFTFQFSGDGTHWVTNNDLSVTLTPLGATYGPCYTNIASTVPNVLNSSLIRLKSIHHTNTGSIFITNLYITTR